MALPGNPGGRQYKRRKPDAIREDHVPGVRHVLRAHGYQVEKSGPLTPRLLRAWKDYRRSVKYGISGAAGGRGTGDNAQPGALGGVAWTARNPGDGRGGAANELAYNKAAKNHPKNVLVKGGKGTKNIVPGSHHKTSPTNPPKGKTSAPADKPGGGGGQQRVVSMAGSDVNKLIPTSMASKIAGLTVDPQIRELATQMAIGKRQNAQNQADISNWGAHVGNVASASQDANAKTASKAQSDVSTAVQNVLASLGGGGGAEGAGVAGVNAAKQLAAQSQTQGQFDDTVNKGLAAETQGQHVREENAASQRDALQQSALVGLRGQRGSAEAQALLEIMTRNNASRQGNFQNRLAGINTQLAGESLGLKAAQLTASINSDKAKTKAYNNKLHPHNDWHTLTLPDRQKVIGDAVKAGLAAIPAGAPWDPGHVQNSALAYLRSFGGYTSARKMSKKGPGINRRNQGEINQALNQAIAAAGQTYNQQQ